MHARRIASTSPRPLLLCALLCLALVVCAGVLSPAARAQDGGGFGQEPSPVPRIEDAESVFRQALDAFEAGDYGMAYRRFQVAENSYPLHRKTTASALMIGKALYRQGEYARADEELSAFLRKYPSSSYVEDARRVRRFARQQLGLEDEQEEVLQLGIALPMGAENASLTQAMFNGLRLAVEEQNRGSGAPVRMIFRDTEGEAAAARRAVTELSEEGADVVVGPLFSRTARPAGEVAEQTRTPMIAPLATDEGVSQGRRYVFQANPTIAMRGRQMARFAMQSLRMERLGVVSQGEGTLSGRMAEAFRAEAQRAGAEVRFFETLPDLRAWGEINERFREGALSEVEAVYMPISGGQSARRIRAALTGLSRLDASVRVLGNAEWHDLPIERQASTFRVTYSNDFYVDETDPQVQAFIEHYREQFGETPDQGSFTARRLAYTGYDVARMVLQARSSETSTGSLREALRSAPLYQGLGVRIDFEGSNVNEALFYHRYRDGRLELLR